MRMEKLLVFGMVDLLIRRSLVLLLFNHFKEVAGELGFDILKAVWDWGDVFIKKYEQMRKGR